MEFDRRNTRDRRIIDFSQTPIPDVEVVGRYNYVAPHSSPPAERFPEHIEIIYLEQGEQPYVIEGREYLLKPNELLLVYPGEEHSTGKVPENRGRLYWVILKASAADGRWLGLSPPFGADLLRRLADRSLPRQFRAQPAVRRHLEHLLSAGDPGGSSSDLKDQELWWGLRMQHQLIECLISVVASRQNNPTKFPTLPLLKMAAAMSRRPEQRRTVAEMAAATRLSVPQFQRRFKEEIGLPPMEYLSRRRIERACEFLEQTDWPITHVALEVGFASSQYFATVFRKFTGTAPREYRALHR